MSGAQGHNSDEDTLKLLRFFFFNYVNVTGGENRPIGCWARAGHPIAVLVLYASIFGVLYGVCHLTGEIYDILLYEKEEDREPEIWPYKGWILLVSFLSCLSWLNFLLFFIKKRCFTASLASA